MDTFPNHLIQLLKTSKYVHLATSSLDGLPSIALMNYIYVPPNSSDINENHYIVFATSKDTEKYNNILVNPHVSLLIHDWMTAKKLTLEKYSSTPDNKPTAGQECDVKSTSSAPSKLLTLLHELNQSELCKMSASLRGSAQIVPSDSNEYEFYKEALLNVNPDAQCFIQIKHTVIVKVHIERAKVSDNENHTSVYQ